MRIFHNMSIHEYIQDTIHQKQFAKVIDEWSVDYEEIEAILVEHFEMMGIYEVYPIKHNEVLKDTIFYQLKYNPKIREKVERMRKFLEDQSARMQRKGGG